MLAPNRGWGVDAILGWLISPTLRPTKLMVSWLAGSGRVFDFDLSAWSEGLKRTADRIGPWRIWITQRP
jgi:hypothetical protein